jgi:hypothetical protein
VAVRDRKIYERNREGLERVLPLAQENPLSSHVVVCAAATGGDRTAPGFL